MIVKNIEKELPPVDVAIAEIELEIERYKRTDEKILKIIHGYGSNGQGGAIKKELANLLPLWKRKHFIFDYIKGEQFTTLRISSMTLPSAVKNLLLNDIDINCLNSGISLIII